MTTPDALRDVLQAEAAGTVGRPPSRWDDVVQRGRHRRRVRRARSALLVGGLALLAVGAVANLRDGDPTGVVANQPDGSSGASETTSTTTRIGLGGSMATAARVSGVYLTVSIDAGEPGIGFDVCTARRPKITETATEVEVELVGADDPGADPWAACQVSSRSAWATVELRDPFGGRRLVDPETLREIPVLANADLLFPRTLPAPFDIDHWDELSGGGGLVDRTFSWSADDLVVDVRTAPLEGSVAIPFGQNPGDGCVGDPITVRGSQGSLCTSDRGYTLMWDEGGYRRQIELGSNDPDRAVPFTVAEALAIADGLEPAS